MSVENIVGEDTITATGGTFTTEHGFTITRGVEAVNRVPTAMLRFAERGGKRILQQCWHEVRYRGTTEVWEDIPVHVEDAGDGA